MPDNSRKLDGKTVVVTRPAIPGIQPDPLGEILESVGATPIFAPVVEFCLPQDVASIRVALTNRSQFGCLVFVSRTGVYFFKQFLDLVNIELASFAHHQIAAIGPGTEEALKGLGLPVHLLPAESNSRGLAQTLLQHGTEPYLIIRADRGSQDLAVALTNGGCSFSELVVYCSRDLTVPNHAVVTGLADGSAHWITVTSSAIAQATVRLYGESLRSSRIATIGPAVSAIMESAGYRVAAQAENANFTAMVDAMIQFERGNAKA